MKNLRNETQKKKKKDLKKITSNYRSVLNRCGIANKIIF